MLALLRNRSYKEAILKRLGQGGSYAVLPAGGQSETQLVKTMFTLMGHVAKLDGLVTQSEVNFASSIMEKMGLSSTRKQQAIDFFERGKQTNYDVLSDLKGLISHVGRRSELAQVFLKTQCRSAYIKGDMRLKEKMLLRDVAEALGYNKAEFLAVCAEVLVTSDNDLERRPNSLRNAYKTLQLQPRVADGEIRQAYLKLMSRYHPDKLISSNLSAESIEKAQQKFLAIRNAYETVCGFRKLRA